MIYILAGNNQQAQDYVGQNMKRDIMMRSDYVIVNSVDQLRGTRDPTCIVVGSFFSRPDAKEIIDTLQTIQARHGQPPAYLDQDYDCVNRSNYIDEFDSDLPLIPNVIPDEVLADIKETNIKQLKEEFVNKWRSFDKDTDVAPPQKKPTIDYKPVEWDGWPEHHGR